MTLSTLGALELVPAIIILVPVVIISIFAGVELARRLLVPVLRILLEAVTMKKKKIDDK